jgi:predicted dinucleotide-binding enzyme
MEVAVLGIGNIGSILARKWAKAGHEVMAGVRDVNAPKAKAFLAPGDANLSLGTPEQAIAFGEVVLFAIPGAAVAAVIAAYAAELDGKIIIDATNNMGAGEMSGLEIFTARTPRAKVFRAFNSLGWENFAEPQFGQLQADLFYCGPDEAPARQAVERLIADIGLNPVYVGGLEQAPLLDALTRLWFSLAVGQKMGRHLAFKVLRPTGPSR